VFTQMRRRQAAVGQIEADDLEVERRAVVLADREGVDLRSTRAVGRDDNSRRLQ
jgi:hypothetical protein